MKIFIYCIMLLSVALSSYYLGTKVEQHKTVMQSLRRMREGNLQCYFLYCYIGEDEKGVYIIKSPFEPCAVKEGTPFMYAGLICNDVEVVYTKKEYFNPIKK